MLHTRATHIVTQDDINEWLADHDLLPEEVADVRIQLTIRLDREPDGGISPWAEVVWYRNDTRGRKYVDPDDADMAAVGTVTVPMRSFPKLTPASPPSPL